MQVLLRTALFVAYNNLERSISDQLVYLPIASDDYRHTKVSPILRNSHCGVEVGVVVVGVKVDVGVGDAVGVGEGIISAMPTIFSPPLQVQSFHFWWLHPIDTAQSSFPPVLFGSGHNFTSEYAPQRLGKRGTSAFSSVNIMGKQS